jgi:hypothetical protein
VDGEILDLRRSSSSALGASLPAEGRICQESGACGCGHCVREGMRLEVRMIAERKAGYLCVDCGLLGHKQGSWDCRQEEYRIPAGRSELKKVKKAKKAKEQEQVQGRKSRRVNGRRRQARN